MNGIPFLKLLYEEKGERKVFDCDWPEQFKIKFMDKKDEYIFIGFLFICGQPVSVTKMKDIFKICDG